MIRNRKLYQEEREYLRNAGGGGAAVVVVEYLETTMSKELLCKFPDNSAFDFDYSQSSIWSPLIPRGGVEDLDIELLGKCLSSSSSFSPTVIQRKLDYNEEDCDELLANNGDSINTTLKKLTANFKKKISTNFFKNLKIYRDTKMKMKMKKKKKNNKKAAFLFSPNGHSAKGTTSNSPTPRKGWAKMLKAAASGQFKKTGKKKECNASHLKLSNNNLAFSNY